MHSTYRPSFGACRNVSVRPAIAGETSDLLIAVIKRRNQMHNRAVVPLGPGLCQEGRVATNRIITSTQILIIILNVLLITLED